MAEKAASRIERDTMGEVEVPAEHYWGAQTQRSLDNFRIGGERMPPALLRALAIEKKASALANMALGELDAHPVQGDDLRLTGAVHLPDIERSGGDRRAGCDRGRHSRSPS